MDFFFFFFFFCAGSPGEAEEGTRGRGECDFLRLVFPFLGTTVGKEETSPESDGVGLVRESDGVILLRLLRLGAGSPLLMLTNGD